MKSCTDSERAVCAQKTLLEPLLSDMLQTCYSRDNELDQWVRKLSVCRRRFTSREVARLYAGSKASMSLLGHGRVAAYSWHR